MRTKVLHNKYCKINNPAASSGVCCLGKVSDSGFNTQDSAASRGVLNPSQTIKIIVLFVFSALAISCQSVNRDIVVSVSRDEMRHNLLELKRMIVPLEAAAAGQGRAPQTEITEARRTITALERDARADSDFAGQLAAWSGRLAVLEGRFSEAQRQHRQSQTLSPGNIPSIILGIRLEGNPVTRLAIIDRELSLAGHHTGFFDHGAGELQIERAKTLAELHRFSEAAGMFDAAFASGIDLIYASSYRDARDRAWEFRHVEAAGGILEILEREGLTWRDSITLVQNETQLLRFLTAGRNISEAEIFNILLDRGFIPFTQDVALTEWPGIRPRPEDLVFRSGAAWLIWHMYAEARGNRGLLIRYSNRFVLGENPRSPIADIPALSPFFDSIVGCVTAGFLYLPDGRNFYPARPLRGPEFLAALRRMGFR